MRKRDIELICGLAEGTLADETEARARVEASPRLKKAYEEQVKALEALSSMGAETMSPTEKAALQRDVWTNLTATPQDFGKAPRRHPVLGYAAAGIFVVVGLVAVINLGSGDGFTTGGGLFEGEEDNFSGGEGLPPPAETPTAGSPTTLPGQGDPGTSPPPSGTDGPGTEISEPVALAAQVRRDMADTQASAPGRATSLYAAEDEEADACIERSGAAGYHAVGEVTHDGVIYLLGIPEDATLSVTVPIVLVTQDACSLVYRDD